MNKDSLVSKVANSSSFSRHRSELIFDRIFELIKESLVKDKEFSVDNFGEFKVEHRESMKIMNTKENQEVLLPPKDFINFTPSQNLLDIINKK
ncbi:MAG: HU family DNA-binding protein [Ignavibacteria bacterium]|jgi:nucleoid DNA-binding protein|nr:HU family DNA-binding protein [Ignavibacteria bacterium]